MANSAVEKLMRYHLLSDEAINDIEHMARYRTRIKRGSDIVLNRQNASDFSILVILDGWACRYIILPNGDRQIIGLMTSGDFSDTRSIHFEIPSFGIMTMTDATISTISPTLFKMVLDRNRDAVLAFAKAQLAEESIMQTWIANMARKSALQRMAHLLCEIVNRVSRADISLRLVIKLPFNQADLADLLGLSAVHVNRVLQSLRANNLIHLRSKWLEISNYAGLVAIADFDPSYLRYEEVSNYAARRIRALSAGK